MRSLVMVIGSCVALLLGVSAEVATAQGKASVTGSLQLDQEAPVWGDTITFTWSVENLPSTWWPLIEIECDQAGVEIHEAYWSAVNNHFRLNWAGGGGADCIGVLYIVKNRPNYNINNPEEPTKNNTLAVVHFSVAP